MPDEKSLSEVSLQLSSRMQVLYVASNDAHLIFSLTFSMPLHHAHPAQEPVWLRKYGTSHPLGLTSRLSTGYGTYWGKPENTVSV